METKTIEQIKDEVAIKNLFENFEQVVVSIDTGNVTANTVEDIINEAMQLYAYQKCEEQIKLCSEGLRTREPYVGVHQEKVLKTPNVCNPKTD